MHVSCSSCGARYAVDPKAIGPTGRTVQCARCNHRWFQTIEPPGRPPESPGTPPEPTPPPVPDIVIRPSVPGAGLPALAPQPPKSPRREVQPMLSCPVCGVHVPQTDAVKGQRGSYCSVAHRRQAEG